MFSGNVTANLAPRVQGQGGPEAAQNVCHSFDVTLVMLPHSEQVVYGLKGHGVSILLDGFEVHVGSFLALEHDVKPNCRHNSLFLMLFSHCISQTNWTLLSCNLFFTIHSHS